MDHREPSHPFRIWIKHQISVIACFVFCGRHFEFLISTRSASARSGTKITGVWDSQISRRIRSLTENDKVTRDETSHFFRRMSLPAGGNGNKMWRRDRKSKCGFPDTHTKRCNKVDQCGKCFGKYFSCEIWGNQHRVGSRACYINRFRRTLRNLFYEKRLPTTMDSRSPALYFPCHYRRPSNLRYCG